MPLGSIHFVTAIGTPLASDESLHEEGLKQHLDDQWAAGIGGLLVGGTMGLMQMLRDETYKRLVALSAEWSQGRGEILVGVGDTGLTRTRDRIELVTRHKIDGVVVLTPYFQAFSQEQLVDYFRSLADLSPVPLYLYDLPAVTHLAIEFETYERLAEHPNIRGAKVSGRLHVARQLIARLGDHHRFRTIVAEPDRIALLLREGIGEHLDGMFAVAPHWTVALGKAAESGDWKLADQLQNKLCTLRQLLLSARSSMGAFTLMMNARGLAGRFHAAPFRALPTTEQDALLAADVMQELIGIGR